MTMVIKKGRQLGCEWVINRLGWACLFTRIINGNIFLDRLLLVAVINTGQIAMVAVYLGARDWGTR